ncbi:MAG: hypothetical protein JWM27_2955 [Gemmatimonadetes bacterium]|nr:hypothetical protein [Gemmatimonadota bacterium]
MVRTTTVRLEDGLLSTPIPAAVAKRLSLSPGSDLLWIDDGRGGFRVQSGTDKTRKVLEAHEQAIADHRDVFRMLAD